MREKGHQNWPLVIALWYDPHLPFSGNPSASLDQNGICLQAVPLSKGWVFPTVPLQSLPVSQEAPRQRPDSFCWLTQPQKEKCNTYLWDYLESRVSLWKRELCSPRMWHQEMVWCCYSGLRRGWILHATNMRRCRLESTWTVWMELHGS